MKINQYKTVYQIAFFPRLFPVNCYLVEEETELTLIDAGLPLSYKGIMEAANTIGKPITKMVLTHVHDDHVGALDQLKQMLPDVPVYVSKRDAKLMNGDRSLEEGEPNTPIRGGVPKKLLTRADVLMKEGDKIGSLLAIDTPGHTPGSMSFFDTRINAIIAGDAFQTKGGIAVAGQLRPFFPFPALATWNKELALKSAKKISDYGPSLLAIGHGQMIEEPKELLYKAIIEAEKKLA
ncbi:MBL fold metallo-hydrolase [Litchfieldia alkalitelluris]|uniref:MBL fold metallo-hydrolase n=1 Tax=Litchfieldia alkalitelluris TaxID=304268 RepID=UPI00099896D5|nr:MBL fold metallo-hydrolase [Litchfieldia alkalitelluris]